MIVNSSRGGGSKDTWVLEDGQDTDRAEPEGMLTAPPTMPDLRYARTVGRPATATAAAVVLARIAHELFWLGRNLARAEHTARMLDGVFQASLQGRPDDPAGVTLDWSSLLAIMGAPPGEAPARRDDVLRALTLDARQPDVDGRVHRARARGRAHGARRHLAPRCGRRSTPPTCSWWTATSARGCARGPYSVYSYVKERSALFWGLTSRTMLRDEASALPRRRRAHRVRRHGPAHAARRAALRAIPEPTSTVEQGQALALLQAVGGFQAYRRAVPAPPNALRSRASCSSSAPTPTRSPRPSTPCTTRSPRGRQPAQLQAGAARTATERRPRVPRGARRPDGGEVHGDLCEAVQQELARVDQDVAERYFAGAAAAGLRW